MTAGRGVAADDSATIRIARVLCIFFMTYVHVPGVDPHHPMPANLWAAHGLLADLLGRASVPALSLLGGFLAVGAYRKRASWLRYARERLVVLGVPLVTWNAMVLVPSLVILAVTGRVPFALQSFTSVGDPGVRTVLDRLVGTEYGSATIALNFLRDLVVCSLLLPALRSFVDRLGPFAVGALWLAGLTVGFAPLILRPHILMFFAIGVYFALRTGELRPPPGAWPALVLAVLLPVAAAAWLAPLAGPDAVGVPETSVRVVMTVAMLLVAQRIGRSPRAAWLARFEPCAYLLFLSHSLVMQALYLPWRWIFGRSLEGPFLAFYVAAPLLAAAAALALHHLLGSWPPLVQVLFTGKSVALRDGASVRWSKAVTPAPRRGLAAPSGESSAVDSGS